MMEAELARHRKETMPTEMTGHFQMSVQPHDGAEAVRCPYGKPGVGAKLETTAALK